MKIRSLVPVALYGVLVWGCASTPQGAGDAVRIVGSDTMLELNRRFAESFMRGHPGIPILVDGGGSGAGIEALIAGTTSIAAASRPLSSAEVARLYEVHQTLGVRFLVAQDALSIYLNVANPVRNLSLEQLRGLFLGTITDWSEVGGSPGPVQVVVRPPSSGTHRFFRDHVLAGELYANSATAVATTRDVLAAVAAGPGTIGYGGQAYRREGVVHCAVDGVEPTSENVGRDLYPLTRYLVFYTTQPPTGSVRDFIDWCLDEDGQRVVKAVGYVPLWSRNR